MNNYSPYPQNWKSYTPFPTEETEWKEFWDKSFGSLACLQSTNTFQKNQNDEKVQEVTQQFPITCNSAKILPEAKNPASRQYKHLTPEKTHHAPSSISATTPSKTNKIPQKAQIPNKRTPLTYVPKIVHKTESAESRNVSSFVPHKTSKKAETYQVRKPVHIKIDQLPPIKSIAPTPSLPPKNIVDQLSAKALIAPKVVVKTSGEKNKPILKAQTAQNLKERPKSADPVNLLSEQNYQLIIKEPCSIEENFEETELLFKDIVESLTVNQAKKALELFLQTNFKENLKKISSPVERRKVYIHLVMICGQAYQDKKDLTVAKKLLEVHSTLIDECVIENEIIFIQLLYPVIEGALDSSDCELKCLGLDMLTAYFSFKPKKIGKEKDLLEKFLLEDPMGVSQAILKKRERLENVFFQLLPQISYEKVALRMSQAKYALPYLLVWLRKLEKENCKWNVSDEECFNHLQEFMQDFSKEELIRVFEALSKVNLTFLKKNEKAFNTFQDVVYNYFSRRFSVTRNNIQEQKDILISFCRNLDKISPKAISHLKNSLEKLCHSIHISFAGEMSPPMKLEGADYWTFSEVEFVPVKPVMFSNESEKVPSDSLVYFTSVIDAMINTPLPMNEGASGIKGKKKTKPAVKVIKKIEDNPNASFAINKIFDHLLSHLPANKEDQKTVFEAIHRLTDEASKQFKFVNSCSQYLLRYIPCYAKDLPFMESVVEYKKSVLDPILDYTQFNRHAWDVYFDLNKEKTPYEVIKSCMRVIEQDRLKFGLTKELQNNLLSNLLAMLRMVLASEISNSAKQNLIDYPLQGLIHLYDVDDSLKEELKTIFCLSHKIYEENHTLRLAHLYKLEAFLNQLVILSEKTIPLQVDVKSDDQMKALKQVLWSFAEEENLESLKNGLKLITLHKKDFEGHFVTLVASYKLLFDSKALVEGNSRELLFSWIQDEFISDDSIFSRTGNRHKGVLVQPEDKKMQADEQMAHRGFVDFLISQYILACKEGIKRNPKKQKIICENFLQNLEKMAKKQYFDVHTLEDSEFLNDILDKINKFFKEYRVPDLYRSCFCDMYNALEKTIKKSDFLAQDNQADRFITKINYLGV